MNDVFSLRGGWVLHPEYRCRMLEDVVYTGRAKTPQFQSLSIYAPEPYLTADGRVDPAGTCGRFTAATAPVVFENNAAGYLQMPHTRLGDSRDGAAKYLERGMVYVTCGCRGRDSRDADGVLCGKSPWSLVDLKTALRFLRHSREALPGDWSRVVSVGWSAGGAMSSLLGVTGDDPRYLPYLEENGAYLDESDAVWAAQIYCPIIDLDHADAAYEWQFLRDPENEDSHVGPAGRMDAFRAALSGELAGRYVRYFNSLGLRRPGTDEPLRFGEDGRSGTAYRWLMELLEEAAGEYFRRLERGALPLSCTAQDYLAGRCAAAGFPAEDKTAWLSWDGGRARIASLDDYVLRCCRRMKPCTSFDMLGMDSGENQEFGTPERDFMHFSPDVAGAIAALSGRFPAEAARYGAAFAGVRDDAALAERRLLLNPMRLVGAPQAVPASYFRIRVGARDADTSFAVSMAFAAALRTAGLSADYALVWEQPHAQADYPGDICRWIEELC